MKRKPASVGSKLSCHDTSLAFGRIIVRAQNMVQLMETENDRNEKRGKADEDFSPTKLYEQKDGQALRATVENEQSNT